MDLTLLYVEDDIATREQLGDVLRLKVQKVYTAKDGDEALDIFTKNKIDMVISDYDMPKLNGNELCEAIKNIDKEMPFVLLTAFHETTLLIKSIEVGVDKFLQKPISSKKLFSVLDNIYEERQKSVALEHSEICLQEAEKIAHLSYWSANVEQSETHFSQESRLLFSQSTDMKVDIDYQDMAEVVVEEDKKKFLKIFQKLIYEQKSVDTIISILDKNKHQLYIHILTKKWKSSICNEDKIVGIFQDITGYEEQKIGLMESINLDPVLPIANKRAALAELQKLIKYSNRDADNIGVIFFDIDNFKHFNDTYGHMFADEILVELSLLIKQNIRQSDIFGRWGGDEFIIITTHNSAKFIREFTSKIASIVSCHPWKNHITLTISVGLAFYSSKMSAQELIEKADFKMFKAKKSGKNRCHY